MPPLPFLAHYGHKPRGNSVLFYFIRHQLKSLPHDTPPNHQTSFALTAASTRIIFFRNFILIWPDLTNSFRSERYYHIIRSHQPILWVVYVLYYRRFLVSSSSTVCCCSMDDMQPLRSAEIDSIN